jgi:protein involved in polysaccharide export with SLBB domain
LKAPRLFLVSALAVVVLGIAPVSAQIPIPVQEQVDIFRSLSAADQQALIRELQSQLPPAQRDAIINMLLQQQGPRTPTGQAAPSPSAGFDATSLAAELLAGVEGLPETRALGPGNTLVVEFTRRSSEEDAALDAFRDRLRDGNPYELDRSGRLYLPGIPAIALSGLNVEQATTRLRAERDLRPFNLSVTLLPLDPLDTAALKPFGYDLFRDPPSTYAPATNIPVPVDYVIGPDDTLNVQLFGSQNAEYFLTVSRDGSINFPQIGPLNVAALSLGEARELIGERVDEALTGVRASVTLGELRSISVFVTGDVLRPGSYTISSLAKMTNALFASGGVAEIGSLRRIALNRSGETVTTLDLYDLLLRGDTSDDARLQQDDVIFVPPVGETVAAVGEVRRPAIYEITGEASIDDLIGLAGGLTPTASRDTIKLERIVPGRGIAVTDLNLAAVPDGAIQVQDGDVIRVEPNLEQLEGSVRLVGNVQRPGLYQWNPGMTLSDLLPSPELVKPMSDVNYVLIRREATPNVEVDALSVDLEAVWQGRAGAADLALEPRDTVHIFHLETGRQQYVRPIIDELRAQADPGEQIPIVRVGGQVRAQGFYPLEPGMRLGDLLRAGGGLRDSAYAIDAELARYTIVDGEYRETELIEINLDAIVLGDGTANVILEPYDYLNIKEISGWREQESVLLRGEFVFPGTYPIRQGEMLSTVLDRAGGLTQFAFPAGSVFTRVELRAREREQLATLARRIEADLAAMSVSDQTAGDVLSTGQSLLNQLRSAQATGRLVIHLDDLMAGDLDHDIMLQGGDLLVVPEFRQEVTVIGEVQYPTSHTFERALARDDYIERSGGLTQRADDSRIYVVRANGEVVAEGGANWFRRGTGVEIRPGDTVVAPLDVDRGRRLGLWTSVTQILYNLAVAVAAVNSF